jgi:hypothetical protein
MVLSQLRPLRGVYTVIQVKLLNLTRLTDSVYLIVQTNPSSETFYSNLYTGPSPRFYVTCTIQVRREWNPKLPNCTGPKVVQRIDIGCSIKYLQELRPAKRVVSIPDLLGPSDRVAGILVQALVRATGDSVYSNDDQ